MSSVVVTLSLSIAVDLLLNHWPLYCQHLADDGDLINVDTMLGYVEANMIHESTDDDGYY